MDIKKIVFIINLLLCGFIFADDSSVKKALVKVYAAHQMFNYASPWQNGQDFNSTATGFIIDGNRIITIIFFMFIFLPFLNIFKYPIFLEFYFVLILKIIIHC